MQLRGRELDMLSSLKKKIKRMNKAWFYLAPAFILLAIFFIWPIINAFILAFTFEGEVTLENFRFLFSDPFFWESLRNTMVFVITVVPICTILSLALAMGINTKIKGAAFFETVYFLPYVTSVMAIGISWKLIFHSDYGLINTILEFFGIAPIEWLNSPEYALISVIIFAIWRGLAFNIIIFLTALRSIDQNLYRAASVDGASSWEQTRRITIPQLNPTITFVFMIGFIHAFKVYDDIIALFSTTAAGPGNSASSLVFYIYQAMYTKYDYNLAAAASLVLLVIILIFTLVQSKITKRIGGNY